MENKVFIPKPPKGLQKVENKIEENSQNAGEVSFGETKVQDKVENLNESPANQIGEAENGSEKMSEQVQTEKTKPENKVPPFKRPNLPPRPPIRNANQRNASDADSELVISGMQSENVVQENQSSKINEKTQSLNQEVKPENAKTAAADDVVTQVQQNDQQKSNEAKLDDFDFEQDFFGLKLDDDSVQAEEQKLDEEQDFQEDKTEKNEEKREEKKQKNQTNTWNWLGFAACFAMFVVFTVLLIL